jgi:hypothetical protein
VGKVQRDREQAPLDDLKPLLRELNELIHPGAVGGGCQRLVWASRKSG